MVTLRPVTGADTLQLWHWHNHPDARTMSWRSEPVSWDHHRAWFASMYPWLRYWIIMTHGHPCGVLRVNGLGYVSIFVAPQARGQGCAQKALQALIRVLPQTLWAFLRVDNHGSRALFARAGFRCVLTVGHWSWYRRCEPSS